MIAPVLGTTLARIIIAVVNLGMVMAVGRALGAEGLGSMSLIVLGVSMVLLVNHVVGGGGLVYLTPRFGALRLLVPSYAWAVLTAVVAGVAVHFLPLAPDGFALHVVALAFLQSLGTIHLGILFGRQRIALYNTLLAGQSILQLCAFVAFLQINGPTLVDFVAATYIANGALAVLSGYYLWIHQGAPPVVSPPSLWAALFRQGGLAQGANLLQLLNYRFAYYVIERSMGLGALGLFSVTTQLAESAWLVPKSIGGVLYSRISNLDEAERQRSLTLVLFKASVLVGAVWCLVLLFIPGPVYSWVFGEEITGLHPILAWMLPGLVAMSGSQVLSHYLSGTGRVVHNTVGSGLGLLVTVPAALALVPLVGLKGAAMAASLAYCVSLYYQLHHFLRITGTPVGALLPHAGDGERLLQVWHRLRSR